MHGSHRAVNGSAKLAICLIVPAFEPSFFGNEHALPLLPGGKQSAMVGCGLPLLAALTPPEHEVTILDENIEAIDFEALRRFDVIGLTGMIVQRRRMVEILARLADLPAKICVGGPLATVDEAPFAPLCDTLFIGEADETWPRFLADFAAGRPTARRYRQNAPTDMSRLPVPRFDLIRAPRYASAAIQFSRGCPFLCEFCDIIVIFGRKPRLKTPEQILAELEALRAAGFASIFFVDDNFIGNKGQAKVLLRALVAWQRERGYPLQLHTEASINLGDEPELLDLLFEAGFRSVFIGIESPRPQSLLETRKVQNVRGDTMDAKLARVRDAGLIVTAGFIVGFDGDDARVFDEQFRFIQRNGLGISIVSMLSPIPSTPLYARLEAERRLVPADDILWFEPKAMSRDTLKAGYHALNRRLYEPAAFFERVFLGYAASPRLRERLRLAQARRPAPSLARRLAASLAIAATAGRLARALIAQKRLGSLGRAYVAAYAAQRRLLRREAWSVPDFVLLCVRHWHHYRIANLARSYWGRAGIDGERADAGIHAGRVEAARVARSAAG